ncbi:MAG: hypothetical protein RIR45_253, partial [Pseudomonadota bacterium]
MNSRKIVVAIGIFFAHCATQAFQITGVSPRGEVAQIRQVVLRFDESAVSFGDPRAEAPADLLCSDAQATRGTGRWTSDREWTFDFERDLPPGVACRLQAKAGFKSAQGQPLVGTSSYQFNSGGPFVKSVNVGYDEGIDEEQAFTLLLNGPATLASVQAHVWCQVEGLGERVAVRLIEGADRDSLLGSQRLRKEAAASPLSFLTLACNRRLPPSAKVQLVFGKGVSSPPSGTQTRGIANTVEKRFSFKVREPFAATFICERENARSACMPIMPMTVEFNAPVSRKLLEGMRLKSDKDSLKPVFDWRDGNSDGQLNRVQFGGGLPEQTQFLLELPKDFKDVSGRSLRNADSFPRKVATAAMPPLAKFAAAPFGIVERFAEPKGIAVLAVTLRNVEAAINIRGLKVEKSPAAPVAQVGKVSDLQPTTDADIIAWFQKVQRFDAFMVSRQQAAKDVSGPLPKAVNPQYKAHVESRMVSLLQGQGGVKTLDLPTPVTKDPRPFEVVGIPLTPGFHVLEIASP